MLAVALPLLVVAWIAGVGFGRTETDRADRRLETEGRAAAAVFVRSVAEADSRAGQLAASRELQQALATRDRAAVEKLVRPGEVVYAGNTLFVGRPSSPAVHRSVSVSIDGTPLGAVTVDVPLDDALLAELRAAAGVDANDRLALIQNRRTIAGGPPGAGRAPVDRTADVTLAGNDYRTFGVNLVGPPANVALVATTPRSGISGGVHNRMFWTLLAIVLTLATVACARLRGGADAGSARPFPHGPRGFRAGRARRDARRRRARVDAQPGQAAARDPPRDDGGHRRGRRACACRTGGSRAEEGDARRPGVR